ALCRSAILCKRHVDPMRPINSYTTTMNPEVHGFAHSPYCIAVESALEALGVSFDRKEVSAADRSSVLRLTGGAYYEVPVLVHGGKVVFESGPESQDVGHYVDDAFGGGRLFPERLRGV